MEIFQITFENKVTKEMVPVKEEKENVSWMKVLLFNCISRKHIRLVTFAVTLKTTWDSFGLLSICLIKMNIQCSLGSFQSKWWHRQRQFCLFYISQRLDHHLITLSATTYWTFCAKSHSTTEYLHHWRGFWGLPTSPFWMHFDHFHAVLLVSCH